MHIRQNIVCVGFQRNVAHTTYIWMRNIVLSSNILFVCVCTWIDWRHPLFKPPWRRIRRWFFVLFTSFSANQTSLCSWPLSPSLYLWDTDCQKLTFLHTVDDVITLSMKPVVRLVETLFIFMHLGPGMQIDPSKRAPRIFVGSRVL